MWGGGYGKRMDGPVLPCRNYIEGGNGDRTNEAQHDVAKREPSGQTSLPSATDQGVGTEPSVAAQPCTNYQPAKGEK